MDTNEIVKKIKMKHELSGASDSLVKELIKKNLSSLRMDLKDCKPSEIRLLTKAVRAELRLYIGRFNRGKKDRKLLLKSGNISALLKTHTSTAERLEFYPELKKIISELNVNSILDLGCGLNPVALASPNIKYYASDINENDLEIVREFFKIKSISGKVFSFDLRKESQYSKLPQAELCLIFKTLDIIFPGKERNKKVSELISSLNSKYLICSFSTKKLSGRKMSRPQRHWFEKILISSGFKFQTFNSENEIFYFISTQETTLPLLQQEMPL